ncbi:zinc metalloprotease HtpX [Tistrella mobilis]|uniref:zinc metalloprotease HtpX n=1 Tax=Tistrella mobilis TaxID=171437 RepID=UPI0035591254
MATTRQVLRNLAWSVLLVAGMALVLCLTSWIVWGPDGIPWALAGAVAAALLLPGLPAGLVLRAHRARPIPYAALPEIHDALAALAARAGIHARPRLCWCPARQPNAFALDDAGVPVVVITDGLLRRLTPPELMAVLAHELAHIANGDLKIMRLADGLGRITGLMAWLGIALLALNLPLILLGAVTVPLAAVLLLIAAPGLVGLMQLALSRTREFAADLEAARLTGDPAALARALLALERSGPWEAIFRLRHQGPGLLRTHPATAERVRRLAAMARPLRPPLPIRTGG